MQLEFNAQSSINSKKIQLTILIIWHIATAAGSTVFIISRKKNIL